MGESNLSVPAIALEHIGKLCLEKEHAVKAGSVSQQRFDEAFNLLWQIAIGNVQPGQHWVDLKNKTFAVRPVDEVRKEAQQVHEITRNGTPELASAN